MHTSMSLQIVFTRECSRAERTWERTGARRCTLFRGFLPRDDIGGEAPVGPHRHRAGRRRRVADRRPREDLAVAAARGRDQHVAPVGREYGCRSRGRRGRHGRPHRIAPPARRRIPVRCGAVRLELRLLLVAVPAPSVWRRRRSRSFRRRCVRGPRLAHAAAEAKRIAGHQWRGRRAAGAGEVGGDRGARGRRHAKHVAAAEERSELRRDPRRRTGGLGLRQLRVARLCSRRRARKECLQVLVRRRRDRERARRHRRATLV